MNGAAESTNGAAPAAEPSPPPAEAPGSSTEPTGGAAPVALTPYQRKKQREAAKVKAAADRRAKREAKKAAPAESAPAEKPDADDDQDDDRDDAQRARETGGFWRLTLRIVSLVLWPFGWRLDALTDKECAEDVALLAPLARRHRWLDLLVRYAALPYLLVDRIASKVKRRDPPAQTSAPPKGAAK